MLNAHLNTKIRYWPGSISLLLLPIFCVCWLLSNHVFDKWKVIQVSYPNSAQDKYGYQISFSESKLKKVISKLDCQHFYLTGNTKADNYTLDNVQKSVRNLLASKSIDKGVHCQLSDSTTYNSFIKILNICMIERATIYAIIDNDVWIMNERPVKKKNEKKVIYRVCGVRNLCHVFNQKPPAESTIFEIIKPDLQNIQSLPFVFIGFGILVFFTFRKSIKK
jgi:hypothetical protein